MSRPNRPGEYWGLEAIGARLNVSPNTVMNWYARWGFLMYHRRHGPRNYWWTTDNLIERWQTARCLAEHEQRQAKRGSRFQP